jgi:hypothetical protein
VGVHRIQIYYYFLKIKLKVCRSKNQQYLFIDAQFPHPLKGLKAYNTTSYNANIQVKIKVQ